MFDCGYHKNMSTLRKFAQLIVKIGFNVNLKYTRRQRFNLVVKFGKRLQTLTFFVDN